MDTLPWHSPPELEHECLPSIPPDEYVPAVQTAQEEVADADEYLPASHRTQADAPAEIESVK